MWQESKFDTCGNASSWVLVGRNEIIFVAIIENIASIANSVQVALWMSECSEADMEFVQNFTPSDFQAENFTPSISPNFNSFSKKKHKKWVKMEKFTPLAKILHCRRQWRHGQIPPLFVCHQIYLSPPGRHDPFDEVSNPDLAHLCRKARREWKTWFWSVLYVNPVLH